MKERWRGGVARLSIMKTFTQEQHVSQVTDVAAGQSQCLDLRKFPMNKIQILLYLLQTPMGQLGWGYSGNAKDSLVLLSDNMHSILLLFVIQYNVTVI